MLLSLIFKPFLSFSSRIRLLEGTNFFPFRLENRTFPRLRPREKTRGSLAQRVFLSGSGHVNDLPNSRQRNSVPTSGSFSAFTDALGPESMYFFAPLSLVLFARVCTTGVSGIPTASALGRCTRCS